MRKFHPSALHNTMILDKANDCKEKLAIAYFMINPDGYVHHLP